MTTFGKPTLSADGRAICIKVPLSCLLVTVTTRDGATFEVSTRALPQAGRDTVIAQAGRYVHDHRVEFHRLLARLPA